MSKGPGRVERSITAAVKDGPVVDGLPRPITYSELARSTYSTTEPTTAQIESVGRACRRMTDRGQVDRWLVRNEHRRHEGAVTRHFTFGERKVEEERRLEREQRLIEVEQKIRSLVG